MPAGRRCPQGRGGPQKSLSLFLKWYNIYSVIRTQIQLPDHLYYRLKRLAEKEETSLAEIVRRAAQLLLEIYPEQAVESWQPPEPADPGRFRIPESDWRIAAHDIEIGEAKTGMD
ncbi:MAG: ribbon-helix-helix protein, CopG family [Planctomycetes bacterium]|nr:ribbon-helix-helix protein, CopG family [Planctomycetota bacterium]